MIKEAKYNFSIINWGFKIKKEGNFNSDSWDLLDLSKDKVKGMWNSVKDYTKTTKCSTPQSIIHNKENVNKPYLIANIANNFFINKIKKIQHKFRRHRVSAISLLQLLIPRIDNNFELPLLTIKDTSKLINRHKILRQYVAMTYQ